MEARCSVPVSFPHDCGSTMRCDARLCYWRPGVPLMDTARRVQRSTQLSRSARAMRTT